MKTTADVVKEFEEFKNQGYKEVLVVLVKNDDCIALCRLDDPSPNGYYRASLTVLASAAMTIAENLQNPGGSKGIAKSMLSDAIKLIDLNPDAMIGASTVKHEP